MKAESSISDALGKTDCIHTSSVTDKTEVIAGIRTCSIGIVRGGLDSRAIVGDEMGFREEFAKVRSEGLELFVIVIGESKVTGSCCGL